MIAVKLWGGLGNQMFQYAFGKRLEALRNDKVSYYTIPFSKELHCNLLNFRVNLDSSPVNHLKKNLIFPVGEPGYRAERKLVQKLPIINPKLYVENSLWFNPGIKQSAVLFDGYWQSYKYFKDISGLIMTEFQPENEIFQKSDPVLAEISACNSVSVHIRRGDYLKGENRRIFAQCGMDYFLEAIQQVIKLVPDPSFFIFSDNIEWVKNKMGNLAGLNVKIVDNSGAKNSAIADFIMMSRCKHNIIANSTFSWWAAWLNQNKDKLVIAPKQWYMGRLNDATVDLIPGTWIRL